MKLIFADNTSIEVKTIFGGQQYLQNAMRDVLTIELGPDVADLDTLKDMFSDKKKTSVLKTSTTQLVAAEVSEAGAEEEGYTPQPEMIEKEMVTEVGQDYTLYLSTANEIREVKAGVPGQVQAPVMEEVCIVKVAQVTYMEKLLEQLLGKPVVANASA